MPVDAGAPDRQEKTQRLLTMHSKTHERLDQFESCLNAICDHLKIGSGARTPSKAGAGAIVPRGSPSSPASTSLSPRSEFQRTLSKTDNLNDRVRANLVRVYGRNRQLLMEAETIILWAALHWSHFHLSMNFCFWRAKCHGDMLREILASRAALHWRMSTVARAFNQWNYMAATSAINKEAMACALNRLFNQKMTQAMNQWRDVAYNLKVQKEAMRHALLRLINKKLAQAWTTWVFVAEEIKRQKFMMAGAINRMLKRKMSMAWEK
jgi:hypothetical protein